MPSAITRDLTPEEARARLEEVLEVYRAAWDASASLLDHLRGRIRHSLSLVPSTRIAVVEDEQTSQLHSMLFGHAYHPSSWWPRQVQGALEAAGLADWSDDAFEVVEVATAPWARGRGFARALLEHLHATMPQTTSLLSTGPDNPARALYRRCGYVELLPNFRYEVTGSPAVVLGYRRA
ncbi:GNAT family N-acetyltransferase [Brachybacterium sp. MASK1Z-5]|uniref:GNAT family N-acetyltransferase n=1 Tax=Brachybacterium halotolerans TaxID=2795215 RepID=A0ABS1B7M6_9MICO|nr:GNAT family N-acetyltransferase [Brachybacterium halotolerans]